ncbi:MAG TPA: FAD-dependent oxidoreductase, partial [Usitatibacteraceae bacterium]|nr:FAD-dependent oxidoreductase [Usitatibacteraceae bacterium]
PGGGEPIYGFPAIDGRAGGVKVATEQHLTETTPEACERTVDPAESRALFEAKVAPCFPGLAPDCVKAVTCLYTTTADSRFVIETHPDVPGAIVASPCSGHGFKHSAALGEALAQLATEGASRLDLSGFGWRPPGGEARA